jgi:hypothetical protein
MESAPVTGLVRTHAGNDLVTDGAGRFGGVIDNIHIGLSIAELLELEEYPSFNLDPEG